MTSSCRRGTRDTNISGWSEFPWEASGSLLTVERYPGVSGVIALAPFIASPEAVAEVRRVGGLRSWNAQTAKDANGWEKRLLTWFRDYDASAPAMPRLVLAYGMQDRFADSLSEFAKVLAPGRVLTQPGGHDWETWRSLWRRSLDLFADELAPRLS